MESMYYSDVTHRLKQAVGEIHADMNSGDLERMKKKIELLNTVVGDIGMSQDKVSLHEILEEFYSLNSSDRFDSEPVDADNQITRP